jgi:hypothetical protein
MREVILVKVFTVVELLEPELTQGFALGIGAYDAVGVDEAGEADAVEAFSVENGSRVSNTFRDI